MATVILDAAEWQLIELLRGREPDSFQLTIYRASPDEWEIEMSFEDQDGAGPTKHRSGSGLGSTFAEAWDDLIGGE